MKYAAATTASFLSKDKGGLEVIIFHKTRLICQRVQNGICVCVLYYNMKLITMDLYTEF